MHRGWGVTLVVTLIYSSYYTTGNGSSRDLLSWPRHWQPHQRTPYFSTSMTRLSNSTYTTSIARFVIRTGPSKTNFDICKPLWHRLLRLWQDATQSSKNDASYWLIPYLVQHHLWLRSRYPNHWFPGARQMVWELSSEQKRTDMDTSAAKSR